MPIAWEELDRITPGSIRMADALVRVESNDPWKNFFQEEQFLK
jgi:bifunctional non-homologous end joining protein LigD